MSTSKEKKNQVQAIQEMRLRLASFNNLDGNGVATSLKEHPEFWRGYVFLRLENLIELRDIDSGYLNADTLFLIPQEGYEDDLLALAQTWDADEVDYIGGEEACKLLGSWSQERSENPQQILRVWWD